MRRPCGGTALFLFVALKYVKGYGCYFNLIRGTRLEPEGITRIVILVPYEDAGHGTVLLPLTTNAAYSSKEILCSIWPIGRLVKGRVLSLSPRTCRVNRTKFDGH